MRSLMVTDVPRTFGDSQLRDLFGRYGRVDRVVLVFDRDERREQARRVAFIDMASADDATAALDGLNGRDVGPHRLRVEPYHEPF